jgi:nitrile hydratase subunit beta
MNGAADMGGMHGFGPVQVEPNEPVFHADWERRIFGLINAVGASGAFTLDTFRQTRESIPPPKYLTLSYYALWVVSLEKLMTDCGLGSPAEIATGQIKSPNPPPPKASVADRARMITHTSRYDRPASSPARFKVGDRVRARNMHPKTHTRLPRYARGHTGTVVCVHGCHVFPDRHAMGLGEEPHWLYTVRFEGHELWGEDSNTGASVSLTAWEPYLDAASAA